VDIYAVGCIAYHLMTGQTPFVAENFMAMLTKHLMEESMAAQRASARLGHHARDGRPGFEGAGEGS